MIPVVVVLETAATEERDIYKCTKRKKELCDHQR